MVGSLRRSRPERWTEPPWHMTHFCSKIGATRLKSSAGRSDCWAARTQATPRIRMASVLLAHCARQGVLIRKAGPLKGWIILAEFDPALKRFVGFSATFVVLFARPAWWFDFLRPPPFASA